MFSDLFNFLRTLSNIELGGVALGLGIFGYMIFQRYRSPFPEVISPGENDAAVSTGPETKVMQPMVFKTSRGITKCQMACTQPIRYQQPAPLCSQQRGCFKISPC